MTGTLFINEMDAYESWGLMLGDGSMNALMLPPPAKSMVENSSRLMHGKQILPQLQRLDSRDVSLIFYIKAKNHDDFSNKLNLLIAEFQKGEIRLRTKYEPRITYRLYYLSSAQLTQIRGELGKITIKFCEPNPTDRS